MKRYLLLFTALGLSPAFAHAHLEHAEPRVGSIVVKPPAALLLRYSEALEAPFCTVTVTGPSGAEVQTSKPQPVPGHADELSVPLHITAPGTYKVVWHALSVDTHRTQGDFSFTVAP
jgi:methionine-rich copper-binding protein CopC